MTSWQLVIVVVIVMGLGCVLESKRTGDEELLEILSRKPEPKTPKKSSLDQDVCTESEPVALTSKDASCPQASNSTTPPNVSAVPGAQNTSAVPSLSPSIFQPLEATLNSFKFPF